MISSSFFLTLFVTSCRSQKCRIPGPWKERNKVVGFLFKRSLGDRFQSSAKDIVLFFFFS
ncbi:hypothetical protein KFK09_022658 [Dendrobium nobile]|uniref:Uncharacterized protein n=1 Tax=Dendrobium nobile TaxID=94219 RepID=A0A8T3AKJ8_DENNO|nr:hypothetical protein KFK09_022658 [Dendrobium nobile]